MTDKLAIPRVKDIKVSFVVENFKYEVEFLEDAMDLNLETFYDEFSGTGVFFRSKVEKVVVTVDRPLANREGVTHILRRTEIDDE